MAERPRYRVAVNLTASVFTQVTNKLFPIIAYAYAQRVLGTVAYGHALFAINLVDTSTPFIEAGTGTYGQILVGRDQADAPRMRTLLGELLTVRALNLVVVAPLFALWVHIWHIGYQRATLTISFMLVTTALDLTYVQTGTQRIWALSLLNIVSKVLVLGGLFWLVRSGSDGAVFAALLIATNSALSLGTLVDATRRWRPALPSRARVLATYRVIRPYALMMVLAYGLDKFDFFLVEAYLGPEEVGLYGGVLRIFLSLQALIPALAMAFGAEMLSLAQPEPFARQAEAAFFALGLVVFPLAVGVWFAGGPLLTYLYDATYLRAAPTFAVLCLGLLPQAIFVVLGMQALPMRGYIRQLAFAIGAGLAAGAGAGTLLVPRLGMLGAALAVVLAKVVAAALVLPRGAPLIRGRRALRLVAPSCAAALAMGAGLYLVRPAGLWTALLWGGGLYAAATAGLQRRRLISLLAERSRWRG